MRADLKSWLGVREMRSCDFAQDDTLEEMSPRADMLPETRMHDNLGEVALHETTTVDPPAVSRRRVTRGQPFVSVTADWRRAIMRHRVMTQWSIWID